MSKVDAVSFYFPSRKTLLVNEEPSRSGWKRCVMYQDRHWPYDLGHCGAMHFVKLSDGRVIMTNDLCDDGWVTAVPPGELIGHCLPSRVCQLKTREAVSALSNMVSVVSSRLEIRNDLLTSEEAYDLHIPHDLPTITPCTYKSKTITSHFSSCEGALLSHIKVGKSELVPLKKLSQLSDADPTVEPVFVLYCNSSVAESEFCLQPGDTIDESFVYDKPEWTKGRYAGLKEAHKPKSSRAPYNYHQSGDYDDYDDYFDNFTPSSGFYRTGEGDTVYAVQGEQPDYTACDKECGYCGRCPY